MYKKVYHVWFNRENDWFPVGVGRNHPVDIREFDNAVDIAQEAARRPGINSIMVVQKETVRFSSLVDGHEYDMTSYLAFTNERLGIK